MTCFSSTNRFYDLNMFGHIINTSSFHCMNVYTLCINYFQFFLRIVKNLLWSFLWVFWNFCWDSCRFHTQLQEMIQDPLHTLASFLLYLQKYTIISPSGFWCWCNIPPILRFPQFYLYYICVYVCVLSFMQFYHLRRLVYLPPHSRYSTVLTLQTVFHVALI